MATGCGAAHLLGVHIPRPPVHHILQHALAPGQGLPGKEKENMMTLLPVCLLLQSRVWMIKDGRTQFNIQARSHRKWWVC